MFSINMCHEISHTCSYEFIASPPAKIMKFYLESFMSVFLKDAGP